MNIGLSINRHVGLKGIDMTPQTEALKLALEALRDNQHLVADNERHAYVMEYNGIIEKCEKTLSQPEQEPAYWQWRRKQDDWQVRMIFSHEVRATTEDSEVRTLYTTQPQRKPLTDEQIDAVMPQPTDFGIVQPPWSGSDITILRAMARAIEAAHGIKE